MVEIIRKGKHDEKPSTINTLLLSIYKPNEPVTTLVLNVFNTDIEYKTGHAIVTFYHPPVPEIIDTEPAEILIAYCDDPCMLHAGDWGDLGTTRILIHMTNAVYQKSKSTKNKIVWKCNIRDVNLTMPEREVPEDVKKTEFYI